jgi:two-component system sensor histidine kinase TctE
VPETPAAEGGSRTATRSLRLTLSLLLLPAMLVGLVLGGAGAYFLSRGPAEDAYDRSLHNAAIAIGGQLHPSGGQIVLDIPAVAERMLRTRQVDALFYRATGPDGRFLGGHADLPAPPAEASEGPEPGSRVYQARHLGLPVRALAIGYPCAREVCQVIVAETTRKRVRLESRIVAGTVLPMLGLTVVLLAVIWFGIARGLFPLERLSRAIQARSPRDLSAIDPRLAPGEARPMVDALNGLLSDVARSNEREQRFIADAAHQLRTPLAGMLAHAELALGEPMSDSSRHELRQVHQGALRTVRIANQLLALASVGTGSAAAGEPERVDASRLAGEMVDGWVHKAMSAEIDIGFELDAAAARGNATLLSEAFDNLVQNALDYCGSGGRVTVRTGARGEPRIAYFEVSDDGPGIPEAERSRVVERFYRIAGTPGTGSGLGLAIAKEIANAHGGDLAIEAADSGRGCRARIELPAAP